MRAARGVRFFVARERNLTLDAGPRELWPPPLRVSAQTDMQALARAISVERKLSRRSTPVVLEAACSRRHALILCQALAYAQRIAWRHGRDDLRLSCVSHVVSALPPGGCQAGGAEGEQAKLLCVLVWEADVADAESESLSEVCEV